MFEQLFLRRSVLARQRAGPFLQERLGYLGHLATVGMARATLSEAATYLLLIAQSLRLAQRCGESIPLTEIMQQARRWANRPQQPANRVAVHHPMFTPD